MWYDSAGAACKADIMNDLIVYSFGLLLRVNLPTSSWRMGITVFVSFSNISARLCLAFHEYHQSRGKVELSWKAPSPLAQWVKVLSFHRLGRHAKWESLIVILDIFLLLTSISLLLSIVLTSGLHFQVAPFDTTHLCCRTIVSEDDIILSLLLKTDEDAI
jgi:hypothetical protein